MTESTSSEQSKRRIRPDRYAVVIAFALVVGIAWASAQMANCPATQPPEPAFVPPAGYPATPPGDWAWYGTPNLWTVVSTGASHERKSVWWSEDFAGGVLEATPQISVTWRRLDGEGVHKHSPSGTGAYTDQDGWFMIAGIDPPEDGCWEATGTYRGSELTYVYLNG